VAIVIVGHRKGGVSKSFTAASLAAYLAKQELSVIVVDMDQNQSSIDWGLIRESHNHQPEIPVLAGRAESTKSVAELANHYDVVIVDIGANQVSVLAGLSKICDLWLMPTDLGIQSLRDTVKVYEAFAEANELHVRGKIPIATFLSRVPTDWNTSEEADAREFLAENCPGMSILKTPIHERKTFRDAGRLGLGGTEMKGRESQKGRAEMQKLFKEAIAFMKEGAK
jgi:chromosome partitioning protein